MSDTPETDAEEWTETNWKNACVTAKFARKLERERDEARRERDAWEKVAFLNAEKLGCLLFGKAEVAE